MAFSSASLNLIDLPSSLSLALPFALVLLPTTLSDLGAGVCAMVRPPLSNRMSGLPPSKVVFEPSASLICSGDNAINDFCFNIYY